MINEYQLSGKAALVTGVSRSAGIGAAVARGLASLGVNVFTTYYRSDDGASARPEEAKEILAELRAEGITAEGWEADLADAVAPRAIFDRAVRAVGPIDILVNNATCDHPADIYAVSADLLDAHYKVNLRGTTLLCAEFAKRHVGRPGGRIINLTSGQSIDPMQGSLPYAMTKGAIEVLTKALSVSLKAKGITVNAVDPGGTETGWMWPELVSSIQANALYNRVGTPQDAMRLILFLASAQADWITGQVLHSRGGL